MWPITSLVLTDQKIPDQLIKITFLEKVETAISQLLNLDLVSWLLVSWALVQITPYWGFGFLFNSWFIDEGNLYSFFFFFFFFSVDNQGCNKVSLKHRILFLRIWDFYLGALHRSHRIAFLIEDERINTPKGSKPINIERNC